MSQLSFNLQRHVINVFVTCFGYLSEYELPLADVGALNQLRVFD